MLPKTCQACKRPFTPERPRQKTCSPECAIAFVQEAFDRQDRAKTRERLQSLKSIADLLREAQAAFNAYVRERDRDLPCVSCGRMHEGKWDAGHYMNTRARPDLRFDEANVHRQCVPCNRHLSGNLIQFRKGLIDRVGLEELARLEGPAFFVRKWTRDELVALRKEYAAKARALKKGTK